MEGNIDLGKNDTATSAVSRELGNERATALFQLQAIVESSEDAIVGMDLGGRVQTWNRAAEAIFGYSAEEMRHRPAAILLPAEAGDETPRLLDSIRRGERVQHYQTQRRRKSGEVFPVSLSLSPIKDEQGTVIGAAVITRDITEQKRAEDRLLSMNRDLEGHVKSRTEELLKVNEALRAEIAERQRTEEELRKAREAADTANQAKSQFIANMSHEMRTPLTAIQGYAEMMYDSRQTVTERLNCIGRIRHHLKNLTELVDDILDLAKVESGRTEVCPVTFSLLPELGEVFALLQSQAWKKRLSFDLTFEGAIPETISTDPSRFRQTLVNLIGNAVKFTERGGVNIVVRLMPSPQAPDRTWLTFTIADTGCGIPTAQQGSLFQPFVQGDGSLTRVYGGTGLGLALSRRVARALGGDVWLQKSQPDRGSTFVVAFDPGPLTGVTMLHNVTKEQMNLRQPAPVTVGEPKLQGMRVLLVEDAPDIQILISHFLRRSGAQVDVAADGYEGIKKAKAGRYDLVLMDIQMPLLNGYEATEQLHREGFTSPIVALTAHAMKGVREKCLKAGCDDYLTKPINASALIELILRYYRKSKGMGAA